MGNAFNYRRTREIIEIIVRDFSGAKLHTFKCNNQENYLKALRMIKQKYGYSFEDKKADDLRWLERK